MASTSKSITAASIGKLIANKHPIPRTQEPLTWSTPVSTILPEDFVLSEARATAETTLEDILSHRSGLPSHDDCYLSYRATPSETVRTVTRNLRNLPIAAAPRTQFYYCNMMYTVATHVVELLTKDTFGAYIQANFFDVRRMDSSYLQPNAVFEAREEHRFATPHFWNKETQLYKELPFVVQPEAQGAGSVQSTVLDYAKWVQAMIRRDEAVFPIEIYDELVKPRTICDATATEADLPPLQGNAMYALGWEVIWYRGCRMISHDGAISGYGSMILFVLQFEFGLVICGNADGLCHIAQAISRELLDELWDVPSRDRHDWGLREADRRAI